MASVANTQTCLFCRFAKKFPAPIKPVSKMPDKEVAARSAEATQCREATSTGGINHYGPDTKKNSKDNINKHFPCRPFLFLASVCTARSKLGQNILGQQGLLCYGSES